MGVRGANVLPFGPPSQLRIPRLTGPGRPSREGEVSLLGMSAVRAGNAYDVLVCQLLKSAWPLREIAVRDVAVGGHPGAR